MKTFNINSKVRIKLTPYGIEKLKEKHEKLSSLCPCIGKFTAPKADEDGYCEMQLWYVMTIFGEYMCGIKLPFEPNIQIDEAKFETEN